MFRGWLLTSLMVSASLMFLLPLHMMLAIILDNFVLPSSKCCRDGIHAVDVTVNLLDLLGHLP